MANDHQPEHTLDTSHDTAPAHTLPTAAGGAAGTRVSKTPAHEKVLHSVTYCGHTKLIFLWPLIAEGYVFYLTRGVWNLEFAGWVFLLTAVVCILAVSVDLSRNYGIFWLVTIGFFVVLGQLFKEKWNIPVLTDIYRFFANRNVTFDPGFGLCLSVLLTVFFLIGLGWAYANNRYTMTHNEVVHHVWGRGDTSVGRGARVITMVYPDWFEFVLCLAGTVVVYDNTGRTVLCRSEHVPLLPFRAKKIDRILESIEVVGDDGASGAAAAGPDASADDLH